MDKIKESFDSLPIAACFFDANGIVRLVNHRMLTVMNYLRPDGVQTLSEMEAALKSPPENVFRLDPQLQVYHFPDDSMLRFVPEMITTKAGTRYTQVTASDVTQLMQRQVELKKENKKLEEANARLRRLFEQMPQIIREEETLQMKLRVHDDIGHSIIASRRVLLSQAGLEEIKANAALWEQSIAVLYRSNQIRGQSDPLETAIDRAHDISVHVLMEGDVPNTPGIRALTALAVNECASNLVRHAGGTELYVHIERNMEGDHEAIEFIFTNNGAPPRKALHEGGGLSMLRQRVEEAGGNMEIHSIPRFMLIIRMPYERNFSYERNDR